MVSIFMVSPNLHLTRCDTTKVSQIQEYQDKLKANMTEANKQLIMAELQYLCSYSRILNIMHTYFSKPVLTPEDECAGLDLISAEMEVFKQWETNLALLKKTMSDTSKIASRQLNSIGEE